MVYLIRKDLLTGQFCTKHQWVLTNKDIFVSKKICLQGIVKKIPGATCERECVWSNCKLQAIVKLIIVFLNTLWTCLCRFVSVLLPPVCVFQFHPSTHTKGESTPALWMSSCIFTLSITLTSSWNNKWVGKKFLLYTSGNCILKNFNYLTEGQQFGN